MSKTLSYDIYTYKGHTYRIIGIVHMKHPKSGAWMPAVCYRGMNSKEYDLNYVRTFNDVVNKFVGIGVKKK